MPRLNQKGVIHLLIPLLLLAGIIAGVYLINAGPLKLFPRAASNPISGPLPSVTPPPDLNTGLVAYWKFDEGSGTTAADSSGNNYTGSLVGSVSWANGKFGKAALFNGSSGSFIKANPPRSGRNTITMAGWVNFDTPSNLNNKDAYHNFFGWDWDARFYFRTYSQEPGAGYFLWFQGSTNNGSTIHNMNNVYNLPTKLTGWHHVAAVYDGTNAKIYLDGSLAKTQAVSGGGAIKNTGSSATGYRSFLIGGEDEFRQYFDGAIDEVRLYYRALSNSEIQQLYNYNPPAPTPTPTSTPTPTPATTATPTPTSTPTPATSKRVFVTSTNYNGNLGDASGADQKCQDRANAANLGGIWKAWISNNRESASTRLNHSKLPYKRLDEVLVANDWNDLTDGSLQNPINITELRNVKSSLINVWTNTGYSGSIDTTDINKNCYSWNNGGSSFQGTVGRLSTTAWSNSSVTACSDLIALYCFEQ